jgi:hypothetical protein
MNKPNASHEKLIKSDEGQARVYGHHVPVLKRPRRKWSIPRPDAGERLAKGKQEESRLNALKEGTTPYGRELLRHLLWDTKRALQSGKQTYTEIEAATAGAVERDRLLKPEWALLIARLLETDPEKLIDGSSLLLGKLIVVMAVGSENSVSQPNR